MNGRLVAANVEGAECPFARENPGRGHSERCAVPFRMEK
jgi:hypothetical protein